MEIFDRFQLLRSQTLPDLVEEEVLRMIKSGELAAGSRLNELELSERLKVSRSIVREAMRSLEQAHLVRQEKNRGMFVREVLPKEAEELYQLRAGLDEMAGRLLAPHITAAELDELESFIRRLEGANGIDETFPLNIAFHDRLVEMTGNTTLLGFYRQIINRMHLLRRRSFSAGGSASHAEHRAILAALRTGDPIASGEAMRAHVDHGFERMRQSRAEIETMPQPTRKTRGRG
ncbi:MAG TPA: GntR family transcriptional regulator [Stellaceae bacterium]|jgi:DNA-binding GntR family transcriptional regulator|nr:GntR family transcriptional regulator [Stellaceae bacterium]